MAVKEIIYTKNERFTVMDNGQITMRKRQKGELYEPSKPVFFPKQKPERPEPSGIDIEQYNIWGEVIYSEDSALRNWRVECENIDEINARDYAEKEKALKKHVIEVRKEYYRQEKQSKKEKAQKQKRIMQIKRASARAWAKNYINKLQRAT